MNPELTRSVERTSGGAASIASISPVGSTAFVEPVLRQVARGEAVPAASASPSSRDEWLADVLEEDLGVPEWRYRRVRYSRVVHERRQGTLPAFLGASCVAFNAERRTLLLHRRSASVATYPGMLHTPGGAWVPGEDESIRRAMLREAYEESGANVDTSRARVLVGREITTGSVQVVWLGARYDQVREAVDVGEGVALELPLDELPDALMAPDWVPSGRMHVVAWLAFVSGDEATELRFGQHAASELAQLVCANRWTAPSLVMADELAATVTRQSSRSV